MKRQRRVPMLIGMFVVVAAALPAAAHASPLLSGYGGPGQGTQAILGAALVNGPSGGGGGSRGGGSQSSPSSSAAVAAAQSAPSSSSPGGQTAPSRSETHRSATIRRGNAPGATLQSGAPRAAGTSNLATGAYPVSERGVAQSSGAFGLSTTGLLEAFLALCALIATLLVTRRLGGASPRPGSSDEQLGAEG